MRTYWDHDTMERAELSEDDVRRLLDFELMEKGVLKLAPFTPATPEPVSLPKVRRFSVKHASGRYGGEETLDIVFATADDAEAFLRLAPMVRVSDYDTGATYVKPVVGGSIAPEDTSSETDVLNARSVLTANKQTEARNREAMRAHEEAAKKVHDATNGVWQDWREARFKRERARQILDTLTEYKALTGGNEATARAFLMKAFTADEVGEALAWSKP